MALTQAIEQARRQTATAANRGRQHRAELRLEEIIKVAGIADQYEATDRVGDLRIETAFARIYQSTADEHVRELVTAAFMAWQDDERTEERVVRGQVDESVALLKVNNPAFINGAFTPDDEQVPA